MDRVPVRARDRLGRNVTVRHDRNEPELRLILSRLQPDRRPDYHNESYCERCQREMKGNRYSFRRTLVPSVFSAERTEVRPICSSAEQVDQKKPLDQH